MKRAAQPSLGVDLGGTWLRVCLAGPDGKIWKRRRLPAVPWRQLPAALAKLDKAWRLGRLEGLAVGSRGVWKARDVKHLRYALRRFAKRVCVMSDLQLAHGAAFNGGAGLLVIGGTGSVAFGRDDKNRILRAGGLGPLLGDEGSAFWIGRQALKNPALAKRWPKDLALRLAHAPDPVRKTAALARVVLSRAADGDPAAGTILRQAAQELAALADELSRRLDFRGPIPVSWHGGLFKDKNFLKRFLRALKRCGRRFSPRPAALTAALAAARLARPQKL